MKVLKAITALALVFSLGACAEEEPVPTPTPDPVAESPSAVVGEERLQEILDEVNAALTEADAESNSEKSSARVVGPAADLRQAEYDLSKVTEDPVSALSTESQLSIVAATDEWPRTVFVATTIPDDANLPLLLALVQETPRSVYQLWSWVRILPGTELPQTAAAAVGSPPVAADSEDLLVAPSAVVKQYVDLLNEGDDDSEYAENFADDSFRELVAKEVSDLNSAVSDAGKATISSAVRTDDGVLALQTYDGGAIVFASITSDLRVEKTVPRGTLKVGKILAYGGDQTVLMDTPLTAHYIATLALYVPPAGSEDTIEVLGAERVLAGVTRGDDEEEDNE